MTLIDNAAQAPKMYVMWVLTAIAALQIGWTKLPPDLVASLPENFVHYATVGLTALGYVARVVKQFWPVATPVDVPVDGPL